MSLKSGTRVYYKPGGGEARVSDLGTVWDRPSGGFLVEWDLDGEEDCIENDGSMPQFCDAPYDCGPGCESCPRAVEVSE